MAYYLLKNWPQSGCGHSDMTTSAPTLCHFFPKLSPVCPSNFIFPATLQSNFATLQDLSVAIDNSPPDNDGHNSS